MSNHCCAESAAAQIMEEMVYMRIREEAMRNTNGQPIS